MKCSECGQTIPKARLECLPETTTCIKCSKVEPILGENICDDTSTEILFVNQVENQKSIRTIRKA